MSIKKKKSLGTPPEEASTNLIHQEGKKPYDARSLRRSLRTRQCNIKMTEELYQLLYNLAQEESLLLAQLVEKALREYAEKRQKKFKLTH